MRSPVRAITSGRSDDAVLRGQELEDARIRARAYTREHGEDIPEVGVPLYADARLYAEHGVPTIEINPGSTPVSERVDVRLRLRAAEALPAILDAAGYTLENGADA